MGKIMGWRLAGETTQSDLVNGLLPNSGLHFLVCADDDTRKAIVSDLAVSIAAGNVANIVQEAKKADGYRLSGGFLGLQAGETCGVAIIEATTQTDIDAAVAWRGIKSFPPIAVSTAPMNDIVSSRLHDLRSEMNVGLVLVLADWSRGVEEIKRILNYRGEFAVLVVSATKPPANVMQGDARVIRVENGQLSLAHPATATPWSRSFSLELIHMASGKAWGVRPGAEAVSVPQFAPAAPEPTPPPREAYAGTVIYWRSVFGLHPLEAERWPEGAIFAEQPYDAARAASEIEGRVEIILALGPESKLDPQEERRRVQTACEQFKIAQRVDVGIASRTLLDARDVRAA
jgi:hypothetical protein